MGTGAGEHALRLSKDLRAGMRPVPISSSRPRQRQMGTGNSGSVCLEIRGNLGYGVRSGVSRVRSHQSGLGNPHLNI